MADQGTAASWLPEGLSSGIANVGYALGLPGMGVTQPMGTPYNVNQTPYSVYNATNSYSQPISSTYNATTAPSGYQPYSGYGGSGNILGATTTNNNPKPTNNDNNSGTKAITEQDALRMGFDWNNLPGGYTRAGGSGGGSSYADQLYSSLGSAYNTLEGGLTPMYDKRKQGIEDIFNSANQGIDLQGQQGQNTINSQRQGVETNQVRSLKDLSNAITQSYGSFSNQLGNMGAGDSSASRVMLPYALSRTEAQQRGQLNRTTADQMSKINESEAKLKSDVMIEKNKLEQGKIGEMASLGEWFDNAKMQISQMRLGDAKAAGAQVMELALKKLQGIEDTYNNKKTALESWALSNSSNLAQLKQNMSATTDPSLLGANPTYDLSGLNNNNITTSASQAPVGYGGYNSIEDTFKKLGVL